MPAYLLLFGPPGAGKGTQGERLSTALGIPHVVISQVLKAALGAAGTQGREAWLSSMNKGHPLPADYVVSALQRVLSSERCSSGAIIDGFPYTLEQAKAFDAQVNEGSCSVSLAIYLSAPREVLMQRIHQRRSRWPRLQQREPGKGYTASSALDRDRSRRRDDDKPEIAAARISGLLAEIPPILQYYRQQGVLQEVDASRTEVEVYRSIIEKVEIYRPGRKK